MNDNVIRGNPQLMKRINRDSVLNCVRQEGSISRVGLAKLTGLSKPSISSIVSSLIKEGILRETGVEESAVGRKPILLAISPSRFSIIGAVFEGTKLTVAVADLSGEVLVQRESDAGCASEISSLVDLLKDETDDLLAQLDTGYDKVLGIGIGLPDKFSPGGADSDPSLSINNAHRALSLEIEELFGIPALVENDVNLMALGEYSSGAGVGHRNLIYVHIGTGIGAGIVLDGKLYRGFSNSAGEIGFMVLGHPPSSELADLGWFEANYSFSAVFARLCSNERAGCSPVVDRHRYLKELPRLIKDSLIARGILEDACHHWAYGLANICAVMNPELIVLGGDIVILGEWALRKISEELKNLVPIAPKVKFTKLREQSGVAGAVYQVIQANRLLKGN